MGTRNAFVFFLHKSGAVGQGMINAPILNPCLLNQKEEYFIKPQPPNLLCLIGTKSLIKNSIALGFNSWYIGVRLQKWPVKYLISGFILAVLAAKQVLRMAKLV